MEQMISTRERLRGSVAPPDTAFGKRRALELLELFGRLGAANPISTAGKLKLLDKLGIGPKDLVESEKQKV
jgi:hypothetical protein